MEMNQQDVVLTFLSIILPLAAAAFIALFSYLMQSKMKNKNEHLREFFATALVVVILCVAFGVWNVISLIRTKQTPPQTDTAQQTSPQTDTAQQTSSQTDTAQQTSPQTDTDNFLKATINGKAEDFYLKNASIELGDINVEFVSYNPRGEIMHTVYLHFDKDIEPGYYSSENGNWEFSIDCGRLSATTFKHLVGKAGKFNLNLTFRSDDWQTYAGTFDATLGRTKLSGTYGDSSMTIENATFQFTLSDT